VVVDQSPMRKCCVGATQENGHHFSTTPRASGDPPREAPHCASRSDVARAGGAKTPRSVSSVGSDAGAVLALGIGGLFDDTNFHSVLLWLSTEAVSQWCWLPPLVLVP
jgi:hypothetical protein